MNPDSHEHSGPQPVTDSVPATLSTLACQVCGHHALHAQELDNGTVRGLSSRLICHSCGAHRVGS
ncbi:hypothetical protein [Haloactinomyces albus]|uniref:Transcription elongation factor Elf1 n=1 Tax=Haloactinomyces albus TaxID=1352928 RepID=A0AAE3ZDB1_9ACTN|nr:hypothetical protein [Haloactinomyces albus]MDR7301444.1 transcription elongation factor Elf1 [Haloactinomyces albus]